jgi:hypothetical protein
MAGRVSVTERQLLAWVVSRDGVIHATKVDVTRERLGSA